MPDLIITVRSEDAVMTTAAQRARALVGRASDLPIKRRGNPQRCSTGSPLLARCRPLCDSDSRAGSHH
jgi:hypothetical protein